MSDMSVINSSTSDAIDQLVIDSGRMHKVINGTAVETITVEDGSLIPSLRKALLDNLYYQTPVIPWAKGSVTQVFNQLYAYTEVSSGAVSWWYAPSATATNPVSMGDSPATDANWRVVLDSATLTGLYATIDSPNFTGLPTAPTVDEDDSSTSIATTAFVNALIAKILQEFTAGDVTATSITVTGDADIFNLKATNGNVTGKLTVQDLEILGDVTGIQTSVDGADIAPKSVKVTEGLEVGGDTLLHGTFQLSGNTVLLGDGTSIDLTNIGSSGTIETSFNLDGNKGNENFIWDATTLNAPIFGSSGKGMSIAKDATHVTQVTWPDGAQSAWVRTLDGTTWSDWSNSIASNTEAVAGTSTDKALSPASGMAMLAAFGLGSDTIQVESDLNTVLQGKMFAYMAGTPNAPYEDVGGRGIQFSSSTGEATQLVIENTNNRLFIRYLTGAAWGAWVEFEGKQGLKGDQGEQGVPGSSAYEVYVSTVPEGEDPLEPADWIASLQGSSFTVDATGATAERANYDTEAKGFSFLDTTTGLLYIKNSSTSGDWADGIPFKGDKGDAGTNGATWYTGTTVPASTLGVNNDLYLLTTTSDVYKKTSGAWAVIANIKGLKGDAGDDGVDGATWYEGSVTPAASLGKDTDLYLHNVTGDVYVKASGAWTVQTNLKGVAGDKGSEWLWGSTAPEDTTGRDGDFFLVIPVPPTDSSNGDVYTKASGAWSYIGNIRGADGDGGGGSGSDGAKWHNGTGVPVASLGADGDYYLRTTTTPTATGNGDVYVKASGAWSVTGNIKGANGADGSAYTLPVATASTLGGVKIGSGVTVAADGTISVAGGSGGTTWLRGTSAPATGTGAVGNYYHNTSTGDVLYKTDATTWATVGVLLPLATQAQAVAATSNLVLMTPARVREQWGPLGFGSDSIPQATNLNSITVGQFFNWGDTTTNIPVAGSYGRGIMLAAGGGYATQLGIENTSGAMYVRFSEGGTWGAWKAVGGSGTLVPATATVLGGIKVGSGLSVTSDGTLSSSGGGGGAANPAAVVGADVQLSTLNTAYNLGLTGDTLPVLNMVYQFKIVLMTDGTAGENATYSIQFKDGSQGAQIFRINGMTANSTGVMTSVIGDQANSPITVSHGPGQAEISIFEGIVQFNYLGTVHPDLTLKRLSGNYLNIRKGSSISYTPVGVVAS